MSSSFRLYILFIRLIPVPFCISSEIDAIMEHFRGNIMMTIELKDLAVSTSSGGMSMKDGLIRGLLKVETVGEPSYSEFDYEVYTTFNITFPEMKVIYKSMTLQNSMFNCASEWIAEGIDNQFEVKVTTLVGARYVDVNKVEIKRFGELDKRKHVQNILCYLEGVFVGWNTMMEQLDIEVKSKLEKVIREGLYLRP